VAAAYSSTVKVWNSTTGVVLNTITGHTDYVYSLAFSPDGTKLLTGSLDNTAKLWNASTGAVIRTFTGHTSDVLSVAFSTDGTQVLTGSTDHTAKLWNASTGAETLTFTGHTKPVQSVAFSPDGTKVLTGGDRTAKLWDASTGILIHTFAGQTYNVYSVAFSPDGTKVLTGSDDNTAKLWNAATGESLDVCVPDLKGQTRPAADTMLTFAYLTTGVAIQEYSDTVAVGSIISQYPEAGTQAAYGSAVNLVVSLGTRPITGTIIINGNRSATNNAQVTLALTWSGGAGIGVVRMRFSNDGSTWNAWTPLQSTLPYTLPGPDGYKTVRVQYLDKLNNRSAVFSDYIRLDTTPPTGAIIINNSALTTTTQSVTLGLTFADGTGAGVTRMRFSDNGSTWSYWMLPATTRAHTLPAGLGYHTVRVQYLDGANNYSPIYNDYIKLVAP
jgi:WD40 repeat protein